MCARACVGRSVSGLCLCRARLRLRLLARIYYCGRQVVRLLVRRIDSLFSKRQKVRRRCNVLRCVANLEHHGTHERATSSSVLEVVSVHDGHCGVQ